MLINDVKNRTKDIAISLLELINVVASSLSSTCFIFSKNCVDDLDHHRQVLGDLEQVGAVDACRRGHSRSGAEERINAFLPVLETVMGSGLVTLEKVKVIRYGDNTKPPATPG